MNRTTSKKNLYGKASMNDQTKTLIKLFIGVIVIVLAVYFGTAIATGEIKLGKKEKTKEEVVIQYDEITSGQILSRNETEYYVLLFEFSSSDAGRYLLLRDNYLNKEENYMYTVDLEKKINQSIFTKDSSNIKKYTSNVNDIKVNTSTIIKVKDGKVIESVEGQENVFAYIRSLYE